MIKNTLYFLFLVCFSASMAQTPYVEKWNYQNASFESDIEFIDLDNDQHLDALISFAAGSSLRVLKGDSQFQFQEINNYQMSTEGRFGEISVGDVNGDGNPDIVTTSNTPDAFYSSEPTDFRVYLGDGLGNFALYQNFDLTYTNAYDGTDEGTISDLVDLDEDGDLDCILAMNYNPVVIFCINDGNGNFTLVDKTAPVNLFVRSIDFADLDLDGDLDVLFAGTSNESMVGGLLLWEQKGALNAEGFEFHSALDIENKDVYSAHFADFNLDGHADITYTCLNNYLADNYMYVTFGTGNDFEFYPPDSTYISELYNVISGDINFDNYPDIYSYGAGCDKIFLNDGYGNFQDHDFIGYCNTSVDAKLVDIDGDHDLDLAIGTGISWSSVVFENVLEPLILLTATIIHNSANLGQKVGEISIMHPDPSAIFNFSLVEGQGDDHNSLFTISENQLLVNDELYSYNVDEMTIRVLAESNTGLQYERNFVIDLTDLPIASTTNYSSSSIGPTSDSRDIVIADFNGDGIRDAFYVNYNDNNEIWLGNGDGTFALLSQNFGTKKSTSAEAADLDDDGDIDLFVTNTNQNNEIWLNDGTGLFQLNQSVGSGDSRDVALGDLDGNGTIDAFVGNYRDAPGAYYSNDGSGMFTLTTTFTVSKTEAVILSDVNADGSLDIIVGNKSEASVYWVNDGIGNFNPISQTINSGLRTTSLAAADFNGDGYIDLVFGTLFGSAQIWLNDTQGGYQYSGNISGGRTLGLAVGDLNGDQTVDIFVANDNGASEAYINDGNANFTSINQHFNDTDIKTYGASLRDFNNDGTLDIFVANKGQSNQLWLNVPSGTGARSDNFTLIEEQISNFQLKFLDGELSIIQEGKDTFDADVHVFDLSGRKIKIEALGHVPNQSNQQSFRVPVTQSVIIIKIVSEGQISTSKLYNIK